MGATSRRKGRRWENEVVAWLRDNGIPSAERNEYLNAQSGDILGVPFWSLECKSAQRIELAAWTDQARRQAETAGAAHHAVIVKRKGTSDAGKAYVVMPLEVFARFVTD